MYIGYDQYFKIASYLKVLQYLKLSIFYCDTELVQIVSVVPFINLVQTVYGIQERRHLAVSCTKAKCKFG